MTPPVEPYQWASQPTLLRDMSALAANVARARGSRRWRGALHLSSYPFGPIARRSIPHDADVYHAHFGPVAWNWLSLVATTGAPLVVSFYGFDASQRMFQQEPWRSRYRSLFERTSAVLVEGPAMAAKVARLGCSESRINVVRLPFTNTSLPEPVAVLPKRWDVIMAGRFVQKKGFGDGLRAVAHTKCLTGTTLIVGAGELEKSLRDLAAELGLDARVVFSGPVPLEELTRLMAASRVALFPSRVAPDGDSEGGAPLTLALAQFAGAAPVVTTHADLAYAAAPATPIVGEGDICALAQGIDLVLSEASTEPDRYLERIKRGRAFVEGAHDPSRLLDARERIYEQVQAVSECT